MNKIIGLVVAVVFSAGVHAGDVAKGQAKTAVCAGCHMADGNSAIPNYPKLAGQGEKYLIKQMHDFKSKKRDNATMYPMVANLSDQDIEDIAAYFSSQKIQHMAVDDQYIQIAEKLYRSGDSDRDIPACMACHGAHGIGIATAGYPAIGGQNPQYTMAALKAFRSGERANDSNEIMRDVVAKMSDKQITALAYYLAGLH
ncbi:MAG: c-type cytochrome [Enterobacterales bacterium]|nr:c-type cytochrome [Enterobacterales bacterium]